MAGVEQPAEHAWLPAPGDVVAGRYRIESVLGRGGMGVVFAAHDDVEQRDVAMKILSLDGAMNLERFLREARVTARIRSEHVVRIFDVASFLGQPLLVMERLRGVDYSARLRNEGPLALGEVADCVVQTCEALAHAAAAAIVHRDIKASNLFAHTMPDGTTILKVLDFGVSKYRAPLAEPEVTLTSPLDGAFLGSPPYMSPEHVRNPKTVDARSDLWALGVVAYRLLSGRFPFEGGSTGAVLAAVLEQDAPRLDEAGANVPADIEAAIRRCLAKSRDDRFANAAELAAAFAPYASARWKELPAQAARVLSLAKDVSPSSLYGAAGPIARDDAAEPRTLTVAPPPANRPGSTGSTGSTGSPGSPGGVGRDTPARSEEGAPAAEPAPRRRPRTTIAGIAIVAALGIAGAALAGIPRPTSAPAVKVVPPPRPSAFGSASDASSVSTETTPTSSRTDAPPAPPASAASPAAAASSAAAAAPGSDARHGAARPMKPPRPAAAVASLDSAPSARVLPPPSSAQHSEPAPPSPSAGRSSSSSSAASSSSSGLRPNPYGSD